MRRRTLLALAPSPLLLAGCGAAARVSESGSGASDGGTSANGTAGTSTDNDSSGALTITDALGRTVTLDALPERIALGESRQVYSLAFLQKDDPVAKVVAWPDDLMQASPDMWNRLQQAAPHAADIPLIGSLVGGDLTLEAVLAHEPDVVVMNLDSFEAAKSGSFFAQMDDAGLPWIITDFRIKPVENTRVSIKALGTVFGREEEAADFLEYYDSIVEPITRDSESFDGERPLVFHWRSPGLSEPGRTYGDSNFGQITASSGGDNLGTKLLDSDEGVLSTEQLIKEQPDLIIASGGEWGHQKINEKSTASYVHLGYDATEESARESLAALEREPGYEQLDAFREGRVYGVYHQFYNAPFNFIVFQAFAAWQQLPGHEDVDIAASWAEFHDRFMPWEASGTVAIGLNP